MSVTSNQPIMLEALTEWQSWVAQYASATAKNQRKIGASNRNRTGTPAMNEAADFKSAVSTYFTIEAVSVT
jgi:hypothetical protein